MIFTSVIFAAQDGISRHLAEAYNVYMVVMIRFWFFAAFALALSARGAGGASSGPSWNQLWRHLAQRTVRPSTPTALSGTT